MVFDSSTDTGFRKRAGSRNEKKWPRKDSLSHDSKLRSPPAEMNKRCSEKFNFFEDEQVQKTGSIFEHRCDMQLVKDFLPNFKLNGFHIKMEDDCPQGGDDVRLSVLRTLGTHNRRFVPCVLCLRSLTVYDRYPLINGTFFLSPIQHSQSPVCMKFESKCAYLHAICLTCMHTKWACARCGKDDWFLGPALIVGTLYTYDVLSTTLCCPPICRHCLSPVLMTDWQRSSMEKSACSACGQQDYHHIRRVDNFKLSDT